MGDRAADDRTPSTLLVDAVAPLLWQGGYLGVGATARLGRVCRALHARVGCDEGTWAAASRRLPWKRHARSASEYARRRVRARCCRECGIRTRCLLKPVGAIVCLKCQRAPGNYSEVLTSHAVVKRATRASRRWVRLYDAASSSGDRLFTEAGDVRYWRALVDRRIARALVARAPINARGAYVGRPTLLADAAFAARA
jgi:hypothetical protein